MNEIKILLIEDDTVDGMFFQRTLKATGISAILTVVEDATSGISTFTNEQFDCVFLDYMLPGTDGILVLNKLRELSDSSIILITSHGDEKIAVEAMKAGAMDYISKNLITAESLSHVIRNVIRFREAENQKKRAEEALKQNERRHRVFFEKSLGFLCTHDLEGNIIDVNPAGAQGLHYSQDELVGVNFKKILAPNTSHLFNEYLIEIRNEKTATGLMKVIDKNGEEHVWSYNNFLYEDENEQYVIGSVQDISDRIHIEEERLNSKRLIAESDEIKKLANELRLSSNKLKDSINYAKRLQDGIYLSEEIFNKIFLKSFVINYPKEIVSGDFYWFNIKNNNKIIALADCTGHGVPGALLSTLGYTMLNNIILNNNIIAPDKILNKLCNDWRKTFDHNNKNINNYDGMEISVCNINYDEAIIEYSGMGGSVFFISDGALTEFMGSSNGISCDYLKSVSNDMKEDLTNHKIPFKENDRIYMFSDGYRDQFGGVGGDDKFSKKRFKNLIITIQQYPMIMQCQLIEEAFHEWKGNNSQIDDVMLIGIEL